MSLIGIDFGTSACVVSTIQRHAVSVVRNELSERLTPTLVGFSNEERYIGETAQSHIKSNYQNTCRYFKQLMGAVTIDEEDIAYERKYSLAPIEMTGQDEGGVAGFLVSYNNQKQVFSTTRCLASLLASLKQMAERSLSSFVEDAVISVPVWYNERSRQAMLDAAKIAGINCLRIMNEHTAIALDYGIYRTNTFDADKSYRVAFISFGHGSAFVSVVDFTRGQLKIIGCEADKHLGGRDIDYAIMEHLASSFQQKYPNINLIGSVKPRLKLEEAANRMKKILSANMEAPVNMECIYEDYDLNTLLTRNDFEILCEPIKEKFVNLLKNTFERHNLQIEDIQAVELVGGCSRIPWVQTAIQQFFQNRLTLSKTLSMDETVARGCVLQAAMLVPRYRVRDYSIIDTIPYPICVSYYSTSTSEATPELKTSVLFEKHNVYGSRKWLTFARSNDFQIQLKSTQPNSFPSHFNITLPQTPFKPDMPKRVRVGIKLNLNGILSMESAQLLVDEEVTAVEHQTDAQLNITSDKNADPATISGHADSGTEATHSPEASSVAGSHENSQVNETSENNQKAEPSEKEVNTDNRSQSHNQNSTNTQNTQTQPSKLKKKVETHKFDCEFFSEPRPGFLNEKCLENYCKAQQIMAANDKKQRDLREAINDLETYVYEMRNALRAALKDFGTPEDIDHCIAALQNAENWIYEVADISTTIEQYQEQLHSIKTLCEPISKRQQAYEACQQALQQLGEVIHMLKGKLSEEVLKSEWDHIPRDKISSLLSKIDEMEKWLDNISNVSKSTPLYADCPINAKTINQEKELLVNFSKTVLVPKPPKPEEQKPKSSEDTENHPTQNCSQTDVDDAMSSNETVPMSDERE